MFHRYRRPRANEIRSLRTPGDIVARQVVLSFGEDVAAGAVATKVPQRLVFGSDFPHNRSTWPRSLEVVARTFEGLPDELRDAAPFGNAAELYDFPRDLGPVSLAD